MSYYQVIVGILVSGAGTADANGVYVLTGTFNGRPYYKSSTNYYLYWDNLNEWDIGLVLGDASTNIAYFGSEQVATPDLVTTWNDGTAGADPPPTVVLNNPPVGTFPTDTNYFQPLSLIDAYIEFDQSCRRAIGEVIGVYNKNPRLGHTHGIDFRPSPRGIDLGLNGNRPPTVFVRYRLVQSEFTLVPWTDATYNRGDLVYSPTTGQCYISFVDSNQGNDPSSDTAGNWGLVPFPEFLSSFVKAGAFADCLRETDPNQADATMAAVRLKRLSDIEAEAEAYLEAEIIRLGAMHQRYYYQLNRRRKRRRTGWCASPSITGDIPTTTLNDTCLDPFGPTTSATGPTNNV